MALAGRVGIDDDDFEFAVGTLAGIVDFAEAAVSVGLT